MSKKFDLGQVVSTAAVYAMREENAEFRAFVSDSFHRYILGDWGDLCDEDKARNDWAVDNAEQILGCYIFKDDLKIYIITEWNRSATTILFPEER